MTTLTEESRKEPRPETYTPGHTRSAIDFMTARTLSSHGHFALPWLARGQHVLDCGCGPGTITLGLADAVFPGTVRGIDRQEETIRRAQRLADGLEKVNVSFREGSAYALPFEKGSFDFVFAHALLEHLSSPVEALAGMRRVLKPGGRIAVCSPDWDLFELTPWTSSVQSAFAAYRSLQDRNGGDTAAGGKLRDWLREAGFSLLSEETHYETYANTARIAGYLALQLETSGDRTSGRRWREWANEEGAGFSQAWTAVVAEA